MRKICQTPKGLAYYSPLHGKALFFDDLEKAMQHKAYTDKAEEWFINPTLENVEDRKLFCQVENLFLYTGVPERKPINRLAWLGAYKETLDQYEKGIHICSASLCSKCILVGNEEGTYKNCSQCPEDTFSRNEYNLKDDDILGCVNRKNDPINQKPTSKKAKDYKKKTERLIEYHKQAIAYLEEQESEEISMGIFQAYLRKIDEEISNQ